MGIRGRAERGKFQTSNAKGKTGRRRAGRSKALGPLVFLCWFFCCASEFRLFGIWRLEFGISRRRRESLHRETPRGGRALRDDARGVAAGRQGGGRESGTVGR